ncbi:UNVERIFIED_CONTAM: hypothetical protein Slati_1190100 [Sesamum latifolium]|uniref:NFD4 C-terminal domain-containing protein n=1 Tax=Sesamum latifolium TaxID=2727402 RepID=A0AAW2XER0_9LAMI
MLVLFFATTCGVGGTLTAIDNLRQIGTSLGYPTNSISTFVSLVSIWNYLGRVVSGFLSVHFLDKYKFPRPVMLTLTLVISCTGHLLIAFDIPNGLYVASVIIGFCFGPQWPLLFSIISQLFGLKYYSTLYNLRREPDWIVCAQCEGGGVLVRQGGREAVEGLGPGSEARGGLELCRGGVL